MSNCRVKLSQRFAKRLLSINTVCCMTSDNEFFLVTPRNLVKRILKWLRVTHLPVDMKQVKNY